MPTHSYPVDPKSASLLDADFFIDALQVPTASLAVSAEAMVMAKAGELAVIPTRNLAVEQFASYELCELQPASKPRPSAHRSWGGEDHDQLYSHYDQVVWRVRWKGHDLQVVHLEWDNGCGGDNRDWVIAQTPEIAEEFILEVNRKTHAPGNAILVFSHGCWNRSESLYTATQAASFDDLVLADDLKATIRDDFTRFLASEAQYLGLGISWRRGALFIGPPGNGKTHCVRSLVKELNVSCLYVQSLSHRFLTAEQMWRQVFDRARGLRPCVLVLEDLDSLVTDDNRSFFLNQLDGFEQNHGLIVLATTNHPDRIDSAIIDRPSRFDRKYHFNLPTTAERADFLKVWQSRLATETGWNADEIEPIAAATSDFSFAYLKELVISSVMTWINQPDSRFNQVMQEQANLLRRQMHTDNQHSRGREPDRRD